MKITTTPNNLARQLRSFSREVLRMMGGPLLKSIGKVHAGQTRQRFVTKQGPDGARWKDWSAGYAATRGPQHSLNINTEDTLKSLSDSAVVPGDGGYTYGPDTPHAAKANAERPFMGVGAGDVGELQLHIDDEISEAMRGYGLV